MHSLSKRHLRHYMSAQRVKEAVQAGSFLRGLGGPRQTDGGARRAVRSPPWPHAARQDPARHRAHGAPLHLAAGGGLGGAALIKEPAYTYSFLLSLRRHVVS